jgi:uncharacterized protein (DUF934 family)
MPLLDDDSTSPSASPPPSSGRDREGGIAEPQPSGLPPSLTPPHKGEGNPRDTRDTQDAGGTVWQNGDFYRNTWMRIGDDAPLSDAPTIVSKKRWLAEREAHASRNAPLGLLIAAGEGVDDIAGDLARFALIALDFPNFSDGRAFSTARLLREKHGFAGELRAVGNVLSDQTPYMRRVGFDSFEVTHEPTRRALIEGRIAEVKLYYQPAGITEAPAGTRPWLRHGPPGEKPR